MLTVTGFRSASTPRPAADVNRQIAQERKEADAAESERVEGLWDRAEEHATRKEGDFSLAWQSVPGVSEKHIFGFYERHATRVRGTKMRATIDVALFGFLFNVF